MGFGRAIASEECRQLTWFSLHVMSDTRRLTLTDWLRLWETTKGCEPVSVGMCDCICLSMRLCGDKSTDACQIDGAFLSIKVLGYLSLKACHSSWFCHFFFCFSVAPVPRKFIAAVDSQLPRNDQTQSFTCPPSTPCSCYDFQGNAGNTSWCCSVCDVIKWGLFSLF